MKKLFCLVLLVLMYATTMAQETKVFVDNKPSTMEEVKKIPMSRIKSMSHSVEDGVAVMRFVLKEESAEQISNPIAIEDNERISAAIQQAYDKSTLLKAGDAAADFTAQTYDGKQITLSHYKGKVVLLNFWATWCAPCLKELAPDGLPVILEKFAGDTNFVFIPVAYTDTKDKLDAFFATQNGKTIYNYLRPLTVMDADKDIFSRYAKSGVPRSFVIGKDGKIIFGSLGARAQELIKIETAINDAL